MSKLTIVRLNVLYLAFVAIISCFIKGSIEFTIVSVMS